MKNIYYLIFLLFIVIFTTCEDKKETSETDNLFKFREYISFNTHGRQSIANPIRIELAKPLDQYEFTQEISSDYISTSPKVKGTLFIENSRTLIFKPHTYLTPSTKYAVTLKLNQLYDDLEEEFNTYTFEFKTIQPSFKINLGNLQSYNKNWQYIEGTIETSDVINLTNAKKILQASQDKRNLKIIWPSESKDANLFNFTIDSIQRKIDDSEIKIKWDGKAIKAENEGENTLPIPGKNNFTVVDIKSSLTEQSSLSVNFSDPLDKNQDFSGLVSIENNSDLRFGVDGNVLHVYPSNRITGKVQVNIFEGIKNTEGFGLKKNLSEWISFDQIKPALKLLSKGTILPNSSSTPIYFEAVNLSSIDIRIIKIYEKNILQFLQYGNLNDADSYNIRRVGRRVAHKTVSLKSDHDLDHGTWKAHAINIADFFNADPGAIYQVEISFKKEYSTYECSGDTSSTNQEEQDDYEDESYINNSITDEEEREEKYWDNEIYNWRNTPYNWEERDNPCSSSYYRENRFLTTNLLGSDLGLIVKESTNRSYHFTSTNLVNAQPEKETHISIYNYQQQLIGSTLTDENGFSILDSEKKAAFAIAKKENNYAYVKLDDGNALSLSKFDVSGKKLEKGLKGFIYTERGVHRPGDSIHLTFVLNDQVNPLPKAHPIQLEITDARGRLVHQSVLSESNTSPSHNSRAKEGFYYFPVATEASAPTGNWNAKISVGGVDFSKTLKVATVKPNRLKINVDFDDEILNASKPIEGKISSTWLHGAPARNLKIEMEATLTSIKSAFDQYLNYEFTDPVRDFDKIEIPILTSQLSPEGKTSFSKKIEIDKKSPGMLKATFVTKVFEGGGDFSLDVFSKNLAPYDYFVGINAPEPKQYSSYFTDENTVFDVVSIDAKGKVAKNREIDVKVYKIEWRWWWNHGEDNLSRYENTSVHSPVQEYTINTGNNAKTQFTVNISEKNEGRYLIRLIDKKSGHATGKITYFYRNWGRRPSDGNAESAKMLVFSADKENYKVGEEAVVTFPSGNEGRALISIENGTEVLSKQWIDTEKGETKFSIPLTEEMAPNVYVNISLLQPHVQTKNDYPIRLYGVIPLFVENTATTLHPELKMPKTLKPEEFFNVEVSEENNQPMTYTLAVVDEGLLNLTRFATPEIHKHFYARQALGVKTFDIYDDVIGAYSGSVDNIYEIGGGDAAVGAKNRKADRFKPVVTYLGPFQLEAGQKNSHKIWMPNYVGAVKTMIIAGDNSKSAYGKTDKTTAVKKPLMVLASLPRKLSPGEKVIFPVTVFAMQENIQNVEVSVKTGEALIPLKDNKKKIRFNEVGEQIVNFEFEVQPSNKPQSIHIFASGNGENAKSSVEIDVENPNPVSQKSIQYTLNGNETKSISFETFGIEGSNSTSMEFSTLPPMDFGKRLSYLIRYPHGCIEQTTSAALPQLFLNDIFDLTLEKKNEAEENIKRAISNINNFQTSSGGLSYWPGQKEVDEWGTNYGGHFMIEAKRKGYALPVTFLSNWIKFQQNAARQWRNSYTRYNSSLIQAYRLYTLALAGQPELAAMNRLRESGDVSNDAKWRLAAAYALAGKKDVAKQISRTANIDFETEDYNQYTYGSPFRNKAMALETMLILEDPLQRELSMSLAKGLSSQKWYSTQETSYALLALAKMVEKNGGKSIEIDYTLHGNSNIVKTSRALAQRKLDINLGINSIEIKNQKDNVVYVNLSQSGKLPLGKESTEQSKLAVNVQYLDSEHKPINVTNLRQGTEITAKVTVTNSTADAINNIALSQIFPSGWEAINTSYTELAGEDEGANYKDIRDDRINFYFNLEKKETKVFNVKLNASYLGTYYLPGTQAEAMYDNTYFARTKGKWINITH